VLLARVPAPLKPHVSLCAAPRADMHGHPTLGVKNAKPRLSSRPGPQIGKLSEEYLRVRNEQMRLKKLTAEMQLAERRGELIEKRLVEAQAAYLVVAMRQKILTLPQHARKFLGLTDAQASKILRELVISILNEIAHLPEQVTDPNWLQALERQDAEDNGNAHPRQARKKRH
jgi:hypothetical protein